MRDETIARVQPWLERAVQELRGTHTVQDVIRACTEGRCTLWVGRRCFAVTEFLNYPQMRVLNVFLAGGEPGPALREHGELQPGIEAFARAGGASRIAFMGKLTAHAKRLNGWSGGCADFEPTHGYYQKELEP